MQLRARRSPKTPSSGPSLLRLGRIQGPQQTGVNRFRIDPNWRHDRLTGEQFLIGIFKSLENQDLNEQTHRVFLSWKVGQRGQDNGVLLALYLARPKARIETGVGLASILTDSVAAEIASGIRIDQSNDKSFAEAIYRILDVLGSPLIQSGKADQLLRSGGLIEASGNAGASLPFLCKALGSCFYSWASACLGLSSLRFSPGRLILPGQVGIAPPSGS